MDFKRDYWSTLSRYNLRGLSDFYIFLLFAFTVSLSLIDATLYQPLYLSALAIAGLIFGYYKSSRNSLITALVAVVALIYYLLFRKSDSYTLVNIIAIAITMSIYFMGNIIGAFVYKLSHPDPALTQDLGPVSESNTLVLNNIDSALAVVAFFTGMILYITSLALPVWECAAPKTRIFGSSVLEFGFAGIYATAPFGYPEPRWLCNFGIIASYIFVFEKKLPAYRVLAFICAIIATTTVYGPYLCEYSGSRVMAIGTGLASGGQMWILSLWILALATAAPGHHHEINTGNGVQ